MCLRNLNETQINSLFFQFTDDLHIKGLLVLLFKYLAFSLQGQGILILKHLIG